MICWVRPLNAISSLSTNRTSYLPNTKTARQNHKKDLVYQTIIFHKKLSKEYQAMEELREMANNF